MSLDNVSEPNDAIDQAASWCLRLAEGRLAPQTRAAFDAWLAADPAHERAFNDVVHTWQAMEHTHCSPDLIEMRRGALDSLRRGHAQLWSRGRRRRGVPIAAAACLALVALTAWVWTRYMPDRYETLPGERRVIVLEDGSQVSLDAQSRVDVSYSSGRRALWLRKGRARFQVTRDALRPFSVSASDKVVVATGTQFSVELLSSQVHVILYQGGVDVLSRRDGVLQPIHWGGDSATGDAPQWRRQVLQVGNELVVGSAESMADVRPVDPARSLSWESGQLVFNEEPLASALERMNRYVDRPLLVGDASVGRIRISGTFLAGDMPAFLEGVTGIFPVRVESDAGREVLVRTH